MSGDTAKETIVVPVVEVYDSVTKAWNRAPADEGLQEALDDLLAPLPNFVRWYADKAHSMWRMYVVDFYARMTAFRDANPPMPYTSEPPVGIAGVERSGWLVAILHDLQGIQNSWLDDSGEPRTELPYSRLRLVMAFMQEMGTPEHVRLTLWYTY